MAWHLRAGAGGNDHLGVAPPEASAGSWFAPFVVRWSSITQPFRSAGCSVIARHRWCGLPSRAKKPESLRSAVFAAGRGGRIALGRPLHQSSAFGRCCRVWSNERMQLTARVLRFAPVSIRRLGLRSARAARLRNEPPVGVRLVHGGRQLMREPLYSARKMPTPNAYASIARLVGRHRRYFIGAGLGGFIILFVSLGILTALKTELPDWAFPFFYFAAWLVALHWPFLIARYWFHPSVAARVQNRSSLPAVLLTARTWLLSCFLPFYLLGAVIGPPLIYCLPGSSERSVAERAVQQDAAADEPQRAPIAP